MDAVRDVEFARGYGPTHAQPGYDKHIAKCRDALQLLQPYVDGLESGPHADACRRAIKDGLAKGRRTHGDAALDLTWCMSGLEAALLGLIGPQGQTPYPQHQIGLPLQPYFEDWLVTVTECPDLIPHPHSTQLVGWHTYVRAWLSPAQIAKLPATEPDLSYDGCRAAIERANRKRMAHLWIGAPSDIEHAAYNNYQKRFREVLAELRRDLAEFAARGLAYVGWTAYYGYE
jgi:hypothetical protein